MLGDHWAISFFMRRFMDRPREAPSVHSPVGASFWPLIDCEFRTAPSRRAHDNARGARLIAVFFGLELLLLLDYGSRRVRCGRQPQIDGPIC